MKRIETRLQQLPREHKTRYFHPPPPQSLKRGRYRQQRIVLYPEFFYTYWYIYIYIYICSSPLLTSCYLHTQALLILIFNFFILWKRFTWWNGLHLSFQPPNKKISSQQYFPSPSPFNTIWKTLIVIYPGFFRHTINYTTRGYMLNADGHRGYRFSMF